MDTVYIKNLVILFLILFLSSLVSAEFSIPDNPVDGLDTVDTDEIWVLGENSYFYSLFRYNIEGDLKEEIELSNSPLPEKIENIEHYNGRWLLFGSRDYVYEFNQDWEYVKRRKNLHNDFMEEINDRWYKAEEDPFSPGLKVYNNRSELVKEEDPNLENVIGLEAPYQYDIIDIVENYNSGWIVISETIDPNNSFVILSEDFEVIREVEVDLKDQIKRVEQFRGGYAVATEDNIYEYSEDLKFSRNLSNPGIGPIIDIDVSENELYLKSKDGIYRYNGDNQGFSKVVSLRTFSEEINDVWVENQSKWIMDSKGTIFELGAEENLIDWQTVETGSEVAFSFHRQNSDDGWIILTRSTEWNDPGYKCKTSIIKFNESNRKTDAQRLEFDWVTGLSKKGDSWYVSGAFKDGSSQKRESRCGKGTQNQIRIYTDNWSHQDSFSISSKNKLFNPLEYSEVTDIDYLGDEKWVLLKTKYHEDSINIYSEKRTLLNEWRKINEIENVGSEETEKDSPPLPSITSILNPLGNLFP